MKPSEYLAKREWIQGEHYKLRSGEIVGCCLMGALEQVYPYTADFDEAYNSLFKFCQTKYQGMFVAQINDNILTTKAEAVALLQEWENTL